MNEMDEMDETVKEFLVESYENLDRLDRSLVDLEKDPEDQDKLADIFRTIHTIKGTCGFLDFSKLESISHEGENLLSHLRDGKFRLTPEVTTGLLELVDAIREILGAVEATGGEGDIDYAPLATSLADLDARYIGSTSDAAATDEPVTPAQAVAEIPVTTAADAPADTGAADPTTPSASQAPQPVDTPQTTPTQPATAREDTRPSDDRRPGVADSSLRVRVGLLDKLMNLVGELVLARNQILQFTNDQADPTFVGATQRLNLVTSELQEGVMKTRMQPIGNIWSKFPRVVRDLAASTGKRVRIEMEGKETDLDKTIIEAIKDPLTHVIRNSVDHGIEPPDVRAANGKTSEGTIRLRAFHEGGQINIQISDDGGGIDADQVRAKAVQKGLLTSEQAAVMTDHQAFKLVFMPGFSTAKTVTNVSGRGVGMDVVKTNIEKIGGTVDIQSTRGEGTTLKIKIPLTLAIIPALMVTSEGQRFAIPQVSLLELVRLEGEQIQNGIEQIGDAKFYRLRGDLLPLVHRNHELGFTTDTDHQKANIVNIVVLKADDRQFGLIVEAINDTEEIVVKPLGKQFKEIRAFAGATIMGDGEVALILDVLGVAQQSQIVAELRDRNLAESDATQTRAETSTLQTLLLFRVSETDRMAIPLDMVARLEEFPSTKLERSGPHEVVQYRGEILPLVSLPKHFAGADLTDRDMKQVIVFTENNRSVGLVVEQILDIVSEAITVQHQSTRAGVIGSAIIQQRVTDLLDVHAVVRATDPTFLQSADAA